MSEQNLIPLDVMEIGSGETFVFAGVYAANEGFFAEVSEQRQGRIRRVAKSELLPNREVAVAWMHERCSA